MKDKSFLDKKNLEAIQNEKKPISEKSWDRINKHFEDKKPAGKIYFLNNYMKVAAGIMLFLSFTWMIYNNNVSVPEFDTVVSVDQIKLDMSVPGLEKQTMDQGKKERSDAEHGFVVENNTTASSVSDEEQNLKKDRRSISNPINTSDKTDLKKEEILQNVATNSSNKTIIDNSDQENNPIIVERERMEIASIETQIPLVYSESFREVNLIEHLRQTEISDSYYEGTSAGAMVGQSLLDLISDNTIVSDLNNKFQKIRKLEVIQINW